MRAGRAVALFVSAAVFVGLATAAGATMSAQTPLSTDGQLTSALLDLESAPAGWATDQEGVGSPGSTSGYCNGPDLVARAQAAGVVASSAISRLFRVVFPVGAGDATAGYPRITERINAFPTAEQAHSLLSATTAAIRGCGSWQAVDADPGTTLRESDRVLAFPKLGDESFAVGGPETTDRPGKPASTVIDDIVYIRLGNRVATMTRIAHSRDLAELRGYAHKALVKLRAVRGAASAGNGSPEAPSGYRRVTVSTGHLNVVVPNSWVAYLPNPAQQDTVPVPNALRGFGPIGGPGKAILALFGGGAPNGQGNLLLTRFDSNGGCPVTSSMYGHRLRNLGATQVDDIHEVALGDVPALEATVVAPATSKLPTGTSRIVAGCLSGGRLFFTYFITGQPVPEDILGTIVSSVTQTG
jgi:hypothetical protein